MIYHVPRPLLDFTDNFQLRFYLRNLIHKSTKIQLLQNNEYRLKSPNGKFGLKNNILLKMTIKIIAALLSFIHRWIQEYWTSFRITDF